MSNVGSGHVQDARAVPLPSCGASPQHLPRRSCRTFKHTEMEPFLFPRNLYQRFKFTLLPQECLDSLDKFKFSSTQKSKTKLKGGGSKGTENGWNEQKAEVWTCFISASTRSCPGTPGPRAGRLTQRIRRGFQTNADTLEFIWHKLQLQHLYQNHYKNSLVSAYKYDKTGSVLRRDELLISACHLVASRGTTGVNPGRTVALMIIKKPLNRVIFHGSILFPQDQ